MQGERPPQSFLGGRGGVWGESQEKSLLDLGLCMCLYLCGADSKKLSGTRLLCLPEAQHGQPRRASTG